MKITLLDGGMGQELVHRAGDNPTPLWSTQVMIERPGLVAEIHRDYFDAGATIATSNTYAIHRDRLVSAGIEDQFEDLLAAAMTEAQAARRDGTQVAGSIGPLIASYRPDIHPAADVAVPLYSEVASKIAAACDLIICETVVSVDHARSILTAAKPAGKPVWLAVSVDDTDGTKLRSGEPLADVIPVAHDIADALLINCSSPEAVGAGLRVIADCGLPFGGYANGFVKITDGFLGDQPTVDALTARHDLGPDAYADHVMSWVGIGATIVGGCCEVGPAHIAEIYKRLRAAGHQIV